MSFSNLLSVGSFVSLMAVLASLISCYFQMRQLRKQVTQAERNHHSLVQQGRSARIVDTLLRLAEPQFRDIVARGRAGDLTMERADIGAFLGVEYAMFLNFEDTFLQHQEGTQNSLAWPIAATRLKDVLCWDGHRAAWKSVRARFGTVYVDAVDRIIDESTLFWAELAEEEQWKADVAAEKARAIDRAKLAKLPSSDVRSIPMSN